MPKEREICHQEAQVELHKSMDAYADMTSSLMMENKTREELIERWSQVAGENEVLIQRSYPTMMCSTSAEDFMTSPLVNYGALITDRSRSQFVKCEYCGTIDHNQRGHCCKCGAPL